MTRPPHEVARARELDARGLNRCQIARAMGVPRRTISGWLNGHAPRRVRAKCIGCGASKAPFPWLVDQAYAYLLGLYLGDGYVARNHGGVYALRIHLDERYPVIVREAEAAMSLVMPMNKVNCARRTRDRCVEVKSYSKHWPCLFPQHGPGMKHERTIELEAWQREICDQSPWRFLRGLIQSAGSRFMNVIRHPKKTYSYPRYTFTNHSEDIRALFCEYCDKVAVEWRRMNRWNISIARRGSVALMDRHIGPKR
jgi:transcriptional regulator with XRE-family HTH domain